MNQNEMTINVTALLDKVTKGLDEAGRHLIFEPINDTILGKMKRGIGEILDRFGPEQQSIDKYLVVTPDLKNRDCILFTHTDDAPRWVKDIFHQMRGDMIQIDFTVTKDGAIMDLTSSWKAV